MPFRPDAPRGALLAVAATVAAAAGSPVAAGAAPASAARLPPDLPVDAARVAALADEPTWRELIRAEPERFGDGLKPAVSGGDFYLSDVAGGLSARAELDATLAAFAAAAAAPPANPDADARCRFPARRLWLADRLGADAPTVPGAGALAAPACPAFEAWIDLDAVEGLTLMHVSGFFGNPASAFGHLLMRVDTVGVPGAAGASGARGLGDLGVNFGARVPPGDGSLVYLYRGLFGGYDAGFLQQDFHVHDAVYSATEQRDMWAYELGLERAEVELVLSHLWELSRARFDYYFFKYNCAWHLSALLELVLDERLRPDLQPWHLPQSVFESLETLDATARPGLIRSVEFVPSLKRESVARFEALPPAEARLANRVIASGADPALLDAAATPTLDFLLGWADYRAAAAADADELTAWRERKRRVLSARLARPVSPAAPAPPGLPRPAAGPSSRAVRLGAEAVGGEGRAVLGVAAYAYDLLAPNRGSLADGGFRLLDLSLGVGGGTGPDGADADDVELRRLDLLAIDRLSPPAAVAGESRAVWRLSLGIVGEDPTCVNCSDVVAAGGIGRAARLPARVPGEGIAYAMLDASLGTDRSLAGPALGLLYRPAPDVGVRLESRLLAATDGDGAAAHELGLAWQVRRQGSLEVAATRVDGLDSVRAGVNLRW